jgi:hypothetical protein
MYFSIKAILVFNQKFRTLDIEQTKDNKYLVTLKILPKPPNDEPVDTDNPKVNKSTTQNSIISQIELNPEDIVILQKFINVK